MLTCPNCGYPLQTTLREIMVTGTACRCCALELKTLPAVFTSPRPPFNPTTSLPPDLKKQQEILMDQGC